MKHRIQNLSPTSVALWGKMSVSQMVKHCNKPYEVLDLAIPPSPPFLTKWMVRLFFKGSMTNEVAYKPNLPTAPHFVVSDDPNFEEERSKLMSNVDRVLNLGPSFFEGKIHGTLGKLNATEWSTMMHKHLDHHLRQFGV